MSAYIASPQKLWILDSDIYGSLTVVLSQEEYDRVRQFEFSHNNQSATHASSSSMSAYIAPQKPWILDSGASFYMTCIKQKKFIKPFQ